MQDCHKDVDRFLLPAKPLVIHVFFEVRVAFTKRNLLATAQVEFFERVNSGGFEAPEDPETS